MCLASDGDSCSWFVVTKPSEIDDASWTENDCPSADDETKWHPPRSYHHQEPTEPCKKVWPYQNLSDQSPEPRIAPPKEPVHSNPRVAHGAKIAPHLVIDQTTTSQTTTA